MTDTTTKKPIRIQVYQDVHPFIKLPKEQVETVTRLFESNGIKFWVDRISISFDGTPYESTIYLRWGMNPDQVQTLLDATP